MHQKQYFAVIFTGDHNIIGLFAKCLYFARAEWVVILFLLIDL